LPDTVLSTKIGTIKQGDYNSLYNNFISSRRYQNKLILFLFYILLLITHKIHRLSLIAACYLRLILSQNIFIYKIFFFLIPQVRFYCYKVSIQIIIPEKRLVSLRIKTICRLAKLLFKSPSYLL
jgi:hypothetical protein